MHYPIFGVRNETCRMDTRDYIPEGTNLPHILGILTMEASISIV
jgi:hypothetical protein